ncbi:cache domain-containing protein [Sulfurimonas sp.]|uniref:cache domain-containing protein n=1 Tax=Sulfurimonas sp. TaxID=2022749 RepID=UPI0025F06E04|nr:cache domain-containing protein [Sulfurimonas sp.]
MAFFTIYFFVKQQNDYFEEESLRVEAQYIQKQKNILKKEIDYIVNYIDHHVQNNHTISEDELKKSIIKYIETIRYEKHGYIWIHDTNYFLIAHPFRQSKIGTLDVDLKDAMGTLITKKFIDETLENPNGVYIEYYWQKPKEVHFSSKLGFFELYEKYNWVIGAGLYIDDIEKSIFENKKLLEKRIDKYIRQVLLVSSLMIIIIGLMSLLISKKINAVFSNYKNNVEKKELELQDINKNLEKRVQKAINEAKKKDRAMLHQSRLARMGAMLSMIAHQWRQPLSEVSGILMELETANKFNKLDDKLLNDSVDESNKIIQFMSHTIDDFRNFFKPDKKKVRFYVDDSCNEAISLAGASIKSYNIELYKKVKCNAEINGYKREFAQVMLNLISNAKDILNQREIQNPKIDMLVDVDGKNVIVTVQDNAGGVKEEHLDLIFEPYFTTKESSKGTGLGLYMSKMIIEKNMNGELTVENTKDGALFKVIVEM